MYPYFDAHCDTLSRCAQEGWSLWENPGHLDLKRLTAYRPACQVFALYADSGKVPPEARFAALEAQAAVLRREQAAGRWGECLLSVEGAELLGCDEALLPVVRDWGVRWVNLTWNRVNALSGTNAEETSRGLTAQGKDFVRKAEQLGVLVDVSHLSDPGFWDVADTLSGPFFASHSNARAVFSHPRNLTDRQFTAIIEHGGVAGLNLFAEFVGGKADLEAVAAHLDHWLELGGEKNIALGGDLDGCSPLAGGMAGIQDYVRLYQFLAGRGYTQALLQDLFFNNLMRVVSKVCTM